MSTDQDVAAAASQGRRRVAGRRAIVGLAHFEHTFTRARSGWRRMVLVAIAIPLATIGGIGWGIGSLVGAAAEVENLGGVAYLDFVAPALVVAGAWQAGAGDSLWPILGHITWIGTYDAMVASALGVPDVVAGHLWWVAYRSTLNSALATGVLLLFGVPHSPWVVLVPVAAVLTAVSVAAPVMAFSATREDDQGFAIVYRLFVMPMFLFSGTFYPVDQLPDVLAALVRVVPLWHGVELARAASLGDLGVVGAAGHVGYLVLWAVAGVTMALRTFERRLLP